MKEFFSPPPVVIANNGGLPERVPGALSTLADSFAAGAEALFLSVRLTADAVPVVIPGKDVVFSDGREVPVFTVKAGELSDIDAGYYFPDKKGTSFPLRGKGERYGTLREILLSFPDEKFVLNLDADSPFIAREVTGLVTELDAVDRILVSSVGGKPVKETRRILPSLATTFSSLGIVGLYFLFRSGLLFTRKKFAADALCIPEAIGPSYVGNRTLIKEVRKRGIAVYIWNVKTAKEIKRLRVAGVNGFICDDLPELRELLHSDEAQVNEDEV